LTFYIKKPKALAIFIANPPFGGAKIFKPTKGLTFFMQFDIIKH